MAEQTSTGRFAVIAGGLAVLVCCGVPWLLSAGAVGALAGVGLGNWLLIGAGLALLAVGIWRRVRRDRRHTGSTTGAVLQETIQ